MSGLLLPQEDERAVFLWKEELRKRVGAALQACGLECTPERIVVEKARDQQRGDYASTIAMVLAKQARRPPRDIAAAVAEKFDGAPWFARASVAGPGFINFRFADDAWPELLGRVLAAGQQYGESAAVEKEKILVEYVSANPTGPLNVVNARAAAYGSALCNILRAVGHEVAGEYYINDAGRQSELFGQSVAARYRQVVLGDRIAPIPDDGYQGDYVIDIARALHEEYGEELAAVPDEGLADWFREKAIAAMVERQKADLALMGVVFDRWYSERRELHDQDKLAIPLELLRGHKKTREAEGALWFISSAYGDEKDRVLIKSDGSKTYFLADLAYHREKFGRGYNRVIDVWGPDHHGHIKRMEAGIAAMGIPPELFSVQIAQQVNLLSRGEAVKMSKRKGKLTTLAELIEEVGPDVAKWFFLMRTHSSHLDFDLDLAVRQSDENPVFYVQYAHARICSIEKNATPEQLQPPTQEELRLLDDPAERALLTKIVQFPVEITEAAAALEPQRLTTYLAELTTLYHRFYTQCRVLTDDLPLTRARLALCLAARRTIANGLRLLGISAPEQM